MTQVAVSFDSVGKRFFASDRSSSGLRTALTRLGFRPGPATTVLDDVTFAVTQGETVAVVGPNGAGKSTILHLAAGVIEPSTGTITVHGRVASILELGGTFLPDLTGRENIRVFHELVNNGQPLPVERERAIATFAGLGAEFDRPIHTYSTGMRLRLAFAGATLGDPDVLLIDEAFAVGDAVFQQQCYRRIRQLAGQGTAILLVTHALQALPGLCDRVLLLDNGQIVFDGPPGPAIDRYCQRLFLASERPGGEGTDETQELRFGDARALIHQPTARHDDPSRSGPFRTGDRVCVTFEVEFRDAILAPHFSVACSTAEGTQVYATTTQLLNDPPPSAHTGERRSVETRFDLSLIAPDVFVDLSVFEVIDGRPVVLDARIGVLHLMLAVPSHCLGLTDLHASIRSGCPSEPSQ